MAKGTGNRRQFMFQLTMTGAGAAAASRWAHNEIESVELLTIDNPLSG